MLAGYYQKSKKELEKKACESYQNLSKDEKTKSVCVVISNIEILQKMKNKG